jgi:hypothetical protein
MERKISGAPYISLFNRRRLLNGRIKSSINSSAFFPFFLEDEYS